MNGKTHWQLAKEEIPDNFYEDEFDQHILDRANMHIQDLENGYHCGDCTCLPASCSKCYAESLIGIDTINGLGSHSASKIDSLFCNGNHWSPFDIRSITEVLNILKNYKVEPYEENEYWQSASKEVYEYHTPRWIKEAEYAYEWLLKYKEEKL